MITTTTIGYGDITPTSPLTKFITVFFALNGVAILALLIDRIRRVRVQGSDDLQHEEETQQ